MNKPYGFRGEIQPKSAADKLTEGFVIDDIEVSVKDCLFEVGFDKPEQEATGRKIAQHLINSWRQRNNVRIEVTFNASWKPNTEGTKDIYMSLTDKVQATDRLTVTTIIQQGMSYIVKQHSDSYSFSNDIDMARKAMKDQILADALSYYGEEVVDDKRPLYGVYKAIEAITKHLGKEGREKLAKLAGKSKTYVDEVMETAQIQRHATTQGKRKLTDQECKERANLLIAAYADTIKL